MIKNTFGKTFGKNCLIIAYVLLAVFIFNLYPAAATYGVSAEPTRSVYVGGFPVGLVIKPKGVIVVGSAPIETELGSMTAESSVRGGDIIESINGVDVLSAEDIREAISASDDMVARVGIKRGTATLTIPVNLINEDMTGEKKLGLRVRENIMGVGTVTYVSANGEFGCLGHPILLENGSPVPCYIGQSYECKILGVNRGARGKAGELKGTFSSSVPNGSVNKNCTTGVYGKFDKYENGELIEVAPRNRVTAGKASIIATVNDRAERYDAEIIKASSQNTPSDKSMIIRITDKRLIALTGGIVQGMSGSPIIQNDRLVGAVTHVFISDPTKGYGIYADWMLQS